MSCTLANFTRNVARDHSTIGPAQHATIHASEEQCQARNLRKRSKPGHRCSTSGAIRNPTEKVPSSPQKHEPQRLVAADIIENRSVKVPAISLPPMKSSENPGLGSSATLCSPRQSAVEKLLDQKESPRSQGISKKRGSLEKHRSLGPLSGLVSTSASQSPSTSVSDSVSELTLGSVSASMSESVLRLIPRSVSGSLSETVSRKMSKTISGSVSELVSGFLDGSTSNSVDESVAVLYESSPESERDLSFDFGVQKCPRSSDDVRIDGFEKWGPRGVGGIVNHGNHRRRSRNKKKSAVGASSSGDGRDTGVADYRDYKQGGDRHRFQHEAGESTAEPDHENPGRQHLREPQEEDDQSRRHLRSRRREGCQTKRTLKIDGGLPIEMAGVRPAAIGHVQKKEVTALVTSSDVAAAAEAAAEAFALTELLLESSSGCALSCNGLQQQHSLLSSLSWETEVKEQSRQTMKQPVDHSRDDDRSPVRPRHSPEFHRRRDYNKAPSDERPAYDGGTSRKTELSPTRARFTRGSFLASGHASRCSLPSFSVSSSGLIKCSGSDLDLMSRSRSKNVSSATLTSGFLPPGDPGFEMGSGLRSGPASPSELKSRSGSNPSSRSVSRSGSVSRSSLGAASGSRSGLISGFGLSTRPGSRPGKTLSPRSVSPSRSDSRSGSELVSRPEYVTGSRTASESSSVRELRSSESFLSRTGSKSTRSTCSSMLATGRKKSAPESRSVPAPLPQQKLIPGSDGDGRDGYEASPRPKRPSEIEATGFSPHFPPHFLHGSGADISLASYSKSDGESNKQSTQSPQHQVGEEKVPLPQAAHSLQQQLDHTHSSYSKCSQQRVPQLGSSMRSGNGRDSNCGIVVPDNASFVLAGVSTGGSSGSSISFSENGSHSLEDPINENYEPGDNRPGEVALWLPPPPLLPSNLPKREEGRSSTYDEEVRVESLTTTGKRLVTKQESLYSESFGSSSPSEVSSDSAQQRNSGERGLPLSAPEGRGKRRESDRQTVESSQLEYLSGQRSKREEYGRTEATPDMESSTGGAGLRPREDQRIEAAARLRGKTGARNLRSIKSYRSNPSFQQQSTQSKTNSGNSNSDSFGSSQRHDEQQYGSNLDGQSSNPEPTEYFSGLQYSGLTSNRRRQGHLLKVFLPRGAVKGTKSSGSNSTISTKQKLKPASNDERGMLPLSSESGRHPSEVVKHSGIEDSPSISASSSLFPSSALHSVSSGSGSMRRSSGQRQVLKIGPTVKGEDKGSEPGWSSSYSQSRSSRSRDRYRRTGSAGTNAGYVQQRTKGESRRSSHVHSHQRGPS